MVMFAPRLRNERATYRHTGRCRCRSRSTLTVTAVRGRVRSGQRVVGGHRRTRRALRCTVRHAELLRLQLAWAAVTVASWMATIALTVVAFDAGGTPAVALAVLVRTLPSAVAGPFLGALIDRRSRSRCLLAAAA